MVNIDKTDELYKYLSTLAVDNIEEVYLELAKNGRYKVNDIRDYFRATFEPSGTQDVEEKELEKVLDYYIDLKTVKHLNSKQIKDLLTEYKQTKNQNIKELIINSKLKDILYLCLNYSTLHKDIDIQDLVQIANLGLIEAVEKYNTTAKLDFNDYVIYYTRENIKKNNEEKTNG